MTEFSEAGREQNNLQIFRERVKKAKELFDKFNSGATNEGSRFPGEDVLMAINEAQAFHPAESTTPHQKQLSLDHSNFIHEYENLLENKGNAKEFITKMKIYLLTEIATLIKEVSKPPTKI